MTAPAIHVTRTASLPSARDGRLLPYSLIALGGLGAALVTGQPGLVALAVPFALAVALGVRRTGPVEITARVALDSDQVLEGDLVTGRIVLEWDGAFGADVMLHRLRGVAPADGSVLSASLPAAAHRIELPLELRATQWGLHEVGDVWVRLDTRFGLLSWSGDVVAGPILRVLPGVERLNRLLDPAESRAVWGAHRSRRLGDGHEFAELRPYVPGDRVRDLNWTATARHGRPLVNRYHPDLSGDVVIALDVFAGGSTSSTEALVRAARAAWAIASTHLRANDRVGLAGMGGSTQWLPPAGGRRARYRLLETLLRIGGEAAGGTAVRSAGHRAAVPPSALVIALTSLHDQDTLDTLGMWRARGRSVAVVLIETGELADETAPEAVTLARRLWDLELDRRKRELARIGIPAVSVSADQPTTPVVTALGRARRAPGVRRSG